MKYLSMSMALCVSFLIAVPQESEACSCMRPDIARSYGYADDVAKTTIFDQLFFAPEGHHWFLGMIHKTFKGCLNSNTWVIVETRSNSAACGMHFLSETYLLNGADRGSFFGIPILGVNSCDHNRVWNDLSDQDLDYLYSRYLCCDGSCACADGTQPVNCYVDPCMYSECGHPDATCESNYCGGCRAEWIDSTGAMADCSVCETEDCSDDTCDPSVEQSCTDPEHVCIAQSIEDTGMCQPFEHGTRVGAGYACGGSIGVSCAEGLFCKGLPYNGIGGSGVCTLMDCQDWSEEYLGFVDANNRCVTADDCQAIQGTSCGCTRNLVLSNEADLDTLWQLRDRMAEVGCNPFISICDCPAADGFVCEEGHCAWNYTDSGL